LEEDIKPVLFLSKLSPVVLEITKYSLSVDLFTIYSSSTNLKLRSVLLSPLSVKIILKPLLARSAFCFCSSLAKSSPLNGLNLYKKVLTPSLLTLSLESSKAHCRSEVWFRA